jgi:two-component system chemotaxis response regulator CheY
MSAVLVVDDDPFIRQLIATTLEETARDRPAEAADGIEALEAVQRDHPQIVFLDLNMPRMGGLEACRQMRSSDEHQPTIVMLTAFAGDENERAAEEAGADLFLTKPFSPLELLNLVDDLNTA